HSALAPATLVMIPCANAGPIIRPAVATEAKIARIRIATVSFSPKADGVADTSNRPLGKSNPGSLPGRDRVRNGLHRLHAVPGALDPSVLADQERGTPDRIRRRVPHAPRVRHGVTDVREEREAE